MAEPNRSGTASQTPPRSQTRNRVLAGTFVFIVGLSLFVAYGIEWVENEVDLGYTEEARRDPFLAAGLFATAEGIESETRAGLSLLDDLPSVGDTILMSTSRRTLSTRRLADLRAWVAAGGHLVVVAQEVFDPEVGESRDGFLDQLGIHLIDSDYAESDDATLAELVEDESGGAEAPDEFESHEEPSEDPDESKGKGEAPKRTLESVFEALSGDLAECEDDEDRLAFMLVEGESKLLQLELPSRDSLSTAEGRWLEAASPAGAQLVRIPVESGVVTALTTMRIWTNARIHCHDHAYLLWFLSRDSAKLWILHDPDVPSLADLLAASFPLTLMGFAALFVVWASSKTLRFGPLRVVATDGRRQLLEHLQATADFGWRGALLEAPLEALREDLRQRVARTGGVQTQGREDSSRRIAELSGFSVEDVELAMTGDPLVRKRDFVKTIQILAASRRHL